MSYTPYRILKKIVAVVNEGDDTLACYPHGKVGARMKGTGKVGIVFSKGVINAPTDEEIALFRLPALSGSVKPIPQDPRGFDKRTSGVARSIKGSQDGREAGIVEKHERDFAKVKRDLEKNVPKSKPEIKAKPVAKPEIKPEPASKPRADVKAKFGKESKPEIEAKSYFERASRAKPKAKARTKTVADEIKEEGDTHE